MLSHQTSAYLALPLMWCWLAHPGAAPADSAPAWSGRSIGDLVATNAPPPPAPAPLHPAREAIQALDETGSGHTPRSFEIEDRLIAAMEFPRAIDEDRLEEHVERTRVLQALRDSEEFVRGQDLQGAVDRLLQEADGITFDASRYMLNHRLGTYYFRMQDYERAADVMQIALSIEPGNPGIASNLAAAQMTLGRLDEAMATLNGIPIRMLTDRRLLFGIHFNYACIHSLKGNPDEAIQHLVRAAEHDAPSTFTSLVDPHLDPVRNDLRFRELSLVLKRHMGQPVSPNR